MRLTPRTTTCATGLLRRRTGARRGLTLAALPLVLLVAVGPLPASAADGGTTTTTTADSSATVGEISADSRLTGSGPLTAWVGGAAKRTYSLTITNHGSETTTKPTVVLTVGKGRDPRTPLARPDVAPIGPGQTVRYDLPVTLAAPAFGTYHVKAYIGIGSEPLSVITSTSSYPWLLFAFGWLMLQPLLLGLYKRRPTRSEDEDELLLQQPVAAVATAPPDPHAQYAADPYAAGQYAADPYAAGQYAADPYATAPYTTGQYATDPYAAVAQPTAPYVPAPYVQAPDVAAVPAPQYAADPLTAPEYAQYPPPQDPQPAYAQPEYAQPQYAGDPLTAPQYAQPGYAPPQYTQQQYAQPEYAPPQYAGDPLTAPQYAQPEYAQPQYAQPGYASPEYAQAQDPGDPFAAPEHAPAPRSAPPEHPHAVYVPDPNVLYAPAPAPQYAHPATAPSPEPAVVADEPVYGVHELRAYLDSGPAPAPTAAPAPAAPEQHPPAATRVVEGGLARGAVPPAP